MATEGLEFHGRVETFVNETSGGVGKNLFVAPGTAKNGSVLGTAAKSVLGITLNATEAIGDRQDVLTFGIGRVKASEAITAVSSGVLARIFAAANGKAQDTPGTPGTYFRGGYAHPSSRSAADADDLVTIILDQGTELVPNDTSLVAIGFALPNEAPSAATTYEIFLAKVPVGQVWEIIGFDLWNTDVGAAGATVDPEIDGTDIAASPITINDNAITSVVAADLVDTSAAAGQVISLEIVTGAATGTCANCTGCLYVAIAAA